MCIHSPSSVAIDCTRPVQLVVEHVSEVSGKMKLVLQSFGVKLSS